MFENVEDTTKAPNCPRAREGAHGALIIHGAVKPLHLIHKQYTRIK